LIGGLIRVRGDRLALEANPYQILVSAQRPHDLLKSKEAQNAI